MKKQHEKILLIGGGGPSISASIMASVLAEQFPLVITAEKKNSKAYIRVTGTIYGWNNSSEELTKKIDEFLADGITDVEVYLNGPGGDVFEAAEIENQIQRFPGSKTGTGGALIASAYTKIAASLDKFDQADNGQYMYHKPSAYLSGNEDKIESSLQLLKNLTTQYKNSYSALTGLTPDEIETNWAKGDVWLTAKEAAKLKFITGVIKKTTITPDTKAMVEACGAPNIPDVTTSSKQLKTMDKEKLALMLGLSSDASDAQIEAAIKANKEAAGQVATLTKEKSDLAEAQLNEKIDALLNGAVTAKKIDASQVENLKTWAKADFTACENHIKALKPLEKVSAAITPGSPAGSTEKKFEDMTAEERDTLANDDPETFKKVYTAYLAK